MNESPFAPPEYKEGIDADAVCGQCGSVNTEGTLLCKVCGNNLRDQRLLRLATDQILQTDGEVVKKPTFLRHALVTLGLLVLVWLAINTGRIMSMLTTAPEVFVAEGAIYTRPEQFWSGAENDIYEGMRQDLMRRYPTAADAENARLSPNREVGILDGHYAVYERMGTGVRFVGAAALQTRGEVLYFLVQLEGVEIRGTARWQNQTLVADWDASGMVLNEEYHAVTGMAVPQATGGVMAIGQTDIDTRNYQAVAYRLPA